MTLLERWRDQLNNYADKHRGTQAFGPNHPAVRAAKRYCERTGAQWEIGVGGRCELGKRALKQWGHEIWANIRARWVLITLPVVLLIIWGFSMNAGKTLDVIATILGMVYIVLGIFMGIFFEDTQYEGELLGDTLGERRVALGAVITTIPVSGPAFILARLFRWEKFQIIAKHVGILLLAIAAVAALIRIILAVGWSDFLIGLAIVAGIIVAASGLVLGFFSLSSLVNKRQNARAAREHALLLNDSVVQARARASIEEALRAYYLANTSHGRSVDGDEVSYEEWVTRLEQMLAKRELGWTDVLAAEYLYTSYDWLWSDPDYTWGFHRFVEGIQEVQRAKLIEQAAARERRRAPVRNALGFVAATLFLMKSKVCPGVILPKMDDVT